MLRGNNGQRIFIDDEDRIHLGRIVGDGIRRYHHRVYAYCWMSNHLHLAVQCGAVPLSRIVQNFSFRYAGHFNRRHERRGHLFQSRFKAILVDADSYLLELIRYIHLNPVRAGICGTADDFPWSGHHSYTGNDIGSWVSTDWVLTQFGASVESARSRYRSFVAQGQGEGRREDFHRSVPEDQLLVDEDFAGQVLSDQTAPSVLRPMTLTAVCRIVCAAAGKDEAVLRARSRSIEIGQIRSVIAYLVANNRLGSLTELARYLGRDVSTLSRGAKAVSEAREGDELFRLLKHAELYMRNAAMQA
jgi:REP element-mobilizing transposase RayT